MNKTGTGCICFENICFDLSNSLRPWDTKVSVMWNSTVLPGRNTRRAKLHWSDGILVGELRLRRYR